MSYPTSVSRTALGGLLIAIAIGLAACARNTAGGGSFCHIYGEAGVVGPIMPSDADTPETIRQVDRLNAVYEAICLDNPPPGG